MDHRKTAVATMKRLSDATGKLNIPGNASRIALIFNSPAGRTTLIQWGPADDNANGVPWPSGTAALKLSYDEHGTAVHEPLTLIDSAGAQQTFVWIEVTLAP